MDRTYERKKLAIYKPNKDATGAAVQFDFAPDKESVFAEFSKQKAEKEFDWANKISIKLGIADIGKILLVLSGKQTGINLYHEASKGGYESAKETKNADPSVQKSNYGYYYKVIRQLTDGTVSSVQVSVSDDEAMIFETLLKKAVERIYGW